MACIASLIILLVVFSCTCSLVHFCTASLFDASLLQSLQLRCLGSLCPGLFPWELESANADIADQVDGSPPAPVDTLRQLELTKISEFCRIKDASSGMHQKDEKEDTAAQQQKELDRQAKRLAALFSDETRWRINAAGCVWNCGETVNV
ncbi:unnamed protein product [Prorocentrum cordatum]|uniref:Uncharacterized protein n=1 Tax=Prorocentrum cordatum TaxID=2364126 RepID=A0ABN9XWJ1_9DINO|nr:unnamed protein product [Polarella glacialis]